MIAVVNISYELLHLVARLKPEKATGVQKAVLNALACYAGYEHINPGLAVLVRHTGFERSAVLRALGALEQNGLIEIEHFEASAGRARGTNLYFFTDWPDDWLFRATSSSQRLVAQSDSTSSSELPDLVNLKELSAYEQNSGIGIDESESARKPIRAQKPKTGDRGNGVKDPAAGLSNGRPAFGRKRR